MSKPGEIPPSVSPDLLNRYLSAADREAVEAGAAQVQAEQTPGLVELAEELYELQQRRDVLEAELKAIVDRQEQLKKKDVPELMQKLGIVRGNKGSYTFSGGRVQLETKLYASVDREVDDVFHSWCLDNGETGLFKESVNAQTLAAWLRDRRSEGLPDPPGVKVWELTQAKLVRAKER
jgi:hypothetical protein